MRNSITPSIYTPLTSTQKACDHCFRTSVMVVVLLCSALTLGCGSQVSSAVSGTVTMDGAPVPDGRVSLAPTSSGTSASGSIVDGKYSVPLEVEAYPATFVVRISSQQPTGRMISHPDGPNGRMEEITEAIPPRYNAESELTITLNSASETEFDFELASKSK